MPGTQRATRGRRHRVVSLSSDLIVDRALELTEREGAAVLTMRRLGEELEQRPVHRVPQLAPPPSPVDDAAVLDRADQPRLGVANAAPVVDERQEGLLQDVLGVLRRDPVAGEDCPQLGPDRLEERF